MSVHKIWDRKVTFLVHSYKEQPRYNYHSLTYTLPVSSTRFGPVFLQLNTSQFQWTQRCSTVKYTPHHTRSMLSAGITQKITCNLNSNFSGMMHTILPNLFTATEKYAQVGLVWSWATITHIKLRNDFDMHCVFMTPPHPPPKNNNCKLQIHHTSIIYYH